MPAFHRILVAVAAALSCALAGCGTISEKVSPGIVDAIPHWAGGLPADAPPRPGTVQYDEYQRERERKRNEPAPAKDSAAKTAPAPAQPKAPAAEAPAPN